MKFSVLMSVYKNDNPSFLEEAIESISEKQSLKPTQIVIVKDGPVSKKITDIIEKEKEKNCEIEFTILNKKDNTGLAAALNEGIKVCKYPWIARMDSDDISEENRFKKQINYIKENDRVDVIGGYISEFKKKPGDIKSERIVGLDEKSIIKMAKKRTPMNHVSVMYKKEIIESIGGYSEDFGKLEDYKLWIDLINADYKLKNIPEILVYVRTGNGFISRRSNKKEIKDWDMLQKYLLKNKIVNGFEALLNKAYIRVFIYMPKFLKIASYKILLRE